MIQGEQDATTVPLQGGHLTPFHSPEATRPADRDTRT